MEYEYRIINTHLGLGSDPRMRTKAVISYYHLLHSPAMLILVSASLPNMIVADGRDILLAICKPHYVLRNA